MNKLDGQIKCKFNCKIFYLTEVLSHIVKKKKYSVQSILNNVVVMIKLNIIGDR